MKAGNRLSKMLDFQHNNLVIYCKKTLAALNCIIIISRECAWFNKIWLKQCYSRYKHVHHI
ncbi:hypothetical protein [Cytobacillus solani]|uniref:hypothetical protein n=1 Tax=Cytobacillus solani TaxID=1637975 RepID=UPI003F75ABC2